MFQSRQALAGRRGIQIEGVFRYFNSREEIPESRRTTPSTFPSTQPYSSEILIEPFMMVQLPHRRSAFRTLTLALSLWLINGQVASAQSAYPNPFAPKPAAPAPSSAPAQSASSYPNPFAPSAGSGSGAGGASAAPSASAYPNPFGSSTGGSSGTGGSAGGSTPGNAGGSTGTTDPDQAWADEICQSDPEYGPTYMAVKDKGGDPWSCVLKPSTTKPRPCFGTKYNNPKTGESVCCARGTTYSFNPTSLQGSCCAAGKSYTESSTPLAQGGCCGPNSPWGASCMDGGSFVHNPLACPVLHRNTRITPSGPRYELFCNVQTKRDILKVEPANSFIECVDACGALAGCLGVDYNKKTKQCYHVSEFMTSETDGAPENDVDSATLVYQDMGSGEICPEVGGEIRMVDGLPYRFFCGKGHWTPTLKIAESAKTTADCARACAAEPDCKGFDFIISGSHCSLKSAVVDPPTHMTSDANSAIALSKQS